MGELFSMKTVELDMFNHNLESDRFQVEVKYHHDGREPVPFIEIAAENECFFSIEPFRGFDISSFRYKNVQISYLAPCGVQHPNVFTYAPGSYKKHIFFGLLTTCGLENTGPDSYSQESNEYVSQHGSLNYSIAKDIDIKTDDETIYIRAKIDGNQYYKQNLVLERTISYSINDCSLRINDTVKNMGLDDEQVCLMYHYNFGFPFLSPDCKITIPYKSAIPKDDYAQTRIEELLTVYPPSNEEKPHVFYLTFPEEEYHRIQLENKSLHTRLNLLSKSDNLPFVDLWKCFQKTKYVMAVEPCNAFPYGRFEQRKRNTAEKIAGGKTKNYYTEIKVEEI